MKVNLDELLILSKDPDNFRISITWRALQMADELRAAREVIEAVEQMPTYADFVGAALAAYRKVVGEP